MRPQLRPVQLYAAALLTVAACGGSAAQGGTPDSDSGPVTSTNRGEAGGVDSGSRQPVHSQPSTGDAGRVPPDGEGGLPDSGGRSDSGIRSDSGSAPTEAAAPLDAGPPNPIDAAVETGNDAGFGDSAGVAAPARLFAATSLWNTTKSATAFWAPADAALHGATYGVNNGAYDHPMYFAKASDPQLTFVLGAGWGNPATTIQAQGPLGMTPATGTDGPLDLLLVDGTLLDMYQATVSGTTVNAKYYGESDGVNGPGFGANGHAAGTTAVGSPQASGTILQRDIEAGVIPHGLDMAFDYSVLGGAGTGGPGDQLPPAVANDDGGGTGPLAEGALLLIPAGTTKPASLSLMGSALWDAAATYGVYITDQLGGSPMFSGDGSAAVTNALSGSDCTAVGQALRMVKNW